MLNNKSFKVAGIGEILWDILPTGKQLGGAPANFAYHSGMLRLQSHIVSAVGNDSSGMQIIDQLNKNRLGTENITVIDKKVTGSVDVSIDQQGKPQYLIHEDVAWDYIPFSNKNQNMIRKLDALCFGSLAQRSPVSASSIQKMVQIAPDWCLKIFDINIRLNYYTMDMIEKSLKISNCLKLNEDEFSLIAKMFSYSGSEEKIIANILDNFELDLIALTKGKSGSSLYAKNGVSVMKSPTITIVDTVGAGDSFTAAMCLGLLQNYPIDRIHQMANRMAAYVCTKMGATPKITDDLLSQLINE